MTRNTKNDVFHCFFFHHEKVKFYISVTFIYYLLFLSQRRVRERIAVLDFCTKQSTLEWTFYLINQRKHRRRLESCASRLVLTPLMWQHMVFSFLEAFLIPTIKVCANRITWFTSFSSSLKSKWGFFSVCFRFINRYRTS